MSDVSSPDGRAVFTNGHWEIAAECVGEQIPLPRQAMNLAERDRIIHQRNRYLEYVHDHFADATVDPPVGYDVVEPALVTHH